MTDSASGRSWSSLGVTIRTLRLLINLRELYPADPKMDIPTAATAMRCPYNTIHQAICRLRAQGLPIDTFPPPPHNQWTGPATHYRLKLTGLDQANVLLLLLVRDQKRRIDRLPHHVRHDLHADLLEEPHADEADQEQIP